MRPVHIGVAHHLGWATVVTADDDHGVVDRRRIELVEPGLPNAPIHHEGGPHALHRRGDSLDDDALADLVARVRGSVERTTDAALDDLAASLPGPVRSIALRAWASDLPDDIALLRRAPHESRADSVMYLEVLARVARERGWTVRLYDARTVEADAASVLGDRADEVLRGPRRTWGAPWGKDQRQALAATIVARTA